MARALRSTIATATSTLASRASLALLAAALACCLSPVSAAPQIEADGDSLLLTASEGKITLASQAGSIDDLVQRIMLLQDKRASSGDIGSKAMQGAASTFLVEVGDWTPGAGGSLVVDLSFSSACGEAGTLSARIMVYGKQLHATSQSTPLKNGGQASSVVTLVSKAVQGGGYSLWLAMDTTDLCEPEDTFKATYTMLATYGAGKLVASSARATASDEVTLLQELAPFAAVQPMVQGVQNDVNKVAKDLQGLTDEYLPTEKTVASLVTDLDATAKTASRVDKGLVLLNEAFQAASGTLARQSTTYNIAPLFQHGAKNLDFRGVLRLSTEGQGAAKHILRPENKMKTKPPFHYWGVCRPSRSANPCL